MFDKVFISYAKEDHELAEKLFDYLLENGFNPWLDKRKLLPGQQWDFEIKKGLREANYVILLLSSNSVKKRGYVQREFKLALKYYEEKLEDDIYLIPIKLNKCEVPENLTSFQWTELTEDASFEVILTSLNIQQNKYLTYQQEQLNKHNTFEIKEFSEEHLHKKSRKSLKIETKYFQFTDNENQSLSELNKFIAGINSSSIIASRSYLLAEEDSDILNHEGVDTWYFDKDISLNFLNSSIVSIIENHYTYTGGAHGSGGITGHNFFISPTFRFSLRELFDYQDYEKVLNFISDYCFQELRKIHNEWLETPIEEIDKQDKTMFWENSLDSEWENFENFLVSKDSISIIFGEYQVSSYAFGRHIIDIPLEEFKKLNLKKSLFHKLETELKK